MDITEDSNLEPNTTAHALRFASHPIAAIPSHPMGKTGSTSKEHSEAEWTDVQPLITSLYITQHQTLSDVTATMELVHGFRATENMYKNRLRKWGVFKNKNKNRLPRCFAVKKVSQPTKRPRTTASLEDLSQAKTIRILDLSTPLTGQTPKDPYLHPMQALAGIREWIEANYASKRWSTRPSQGARDRTAPLGRSSSESLELHLIFIFAFSLYRRGELQLAGKAIRKAFLVLESAVLDDSAEMILHIVHIMVDLVLRKQTDVLSSFLEHLSELTSRNFPTSHPLVKISTNLYCVDEGIQFWLLRALKCAMDTFMAHLGNRHAELPHLHWLKGVVEPIGERQLLMDPSVVTQHADTYGSGPPSMLIFSNMQIMLLAKNKARYAEDPFSMEMIRIQATMVTSAVQATFCSRWDIAYEIWRDVANLESQSPWSHPISVVEKLWMAKVASYYAGHTDHTELGTLALQKAREYLEHIPDCNA